MNYALILVTVIKEAVYIGHEPTERATWFNVYMHCAALENGGVLEDCAKWKDRTWQQTCGVTLAEIKSANGLLNFKGNDLYVALYDGQRDNEERGRAKRAHAKMMANAKYGNAPAPPARDKPRAPLGDEDPTLEMVKAEFQRSGGSAEMAEGFFTKYDATSWMMGNTPITKWRALVGKYIANWRGNEHADKTRGRRTTESTEAKAARSERVSARIFKAGGKPA